MAMKRAMHAYISDEAHDGWQAFADSNGVSKSGLVEMLGVMLGDGDGDGDGASSLDLDKLVKGARKIDGERRRR